ncbi:hypothetical protein J6590_026032 [Homalodisca vitripennis]|nr:hypothetical protein J6590_026032 [Homalodisca vitripennis]
MSSKDELLKNHFEVETKHEGQIKRQMSLEDIIDWFRRLQIFEKLKIVESDVVAVFEKMKKKFLTTAQDFLNFLRELAERNNIDLEEMKGKMLQQMEAFDTLEMQFREQIKKGKANLQDVKVWLERNKVKVAESDVAKAFDRMKQTASTVTYEDLVNGVKELGTKQKANVTSVLNKILDPGFLPLTNKEENNKKTDGKENSKKTDEKKN